MGEVRNVRKIKTRLHLQSGVTERRSLIPINGYTSHNNTGFYSTSCEDWTAVEDSSQESFKAQNSPFCIRGAVMGYVVISWKHYFKQDADFIKTCEIREADSSASRCLLVNSYFEKGLL